jgi:CHAT domain-containing protein
MRLRLEPISQTHAQTVTEFHIPYSTNVALVVRLEAERKDGQAESYISIYRSDVSKNPAKKTLLRIGRSDTDLADGNWEIDFHFGLVTVSHAGRPLLSGYLPRVQSVAGVIIRQQVGHLSLDRLEMSAEPRETATLPEDRIDQIQKAADLLARARQLNLEGDALEAVKLGNESLHEYGAALGNRHPWSIEAQAFLGFCECRLPDGISSGRQKLHAALTTGRDVLGPGHPIVAELWAQLAGQRLELGDDAGAQRAFQEALGIFESTMGTDGEEFVTTAIQAGAAAAQAGAQELAGQYFERSLSAARRAWPEGHRLVGTAMQHLAMHYVHTNRRNESRPLLVECRELADRTGSLTDRIVARVNLAELEFADRQLPACKAQYAAARELAAQLPATDRIPWVTTSVCLGLVEQELGNGDASLAVVEEAYKTVARLYPADHPMVGQARLALAAATQMQGDYARGLALFDADWDRRLRWMGQAILTASEAEGREIAHTLYSDRDMYLSFAHRLEEPSVEGAYERVWQSSAVVRRGQQRLQELARLSPELQDARKELLALSSRLASLQGLPENEARQALETRLLESKEQLESRIRAKAFRSTANGHESDEQDFQNWMRKFPEGTALLHIIRATIRDNDSYPYDLFLIARQAGAAPVVTWLRLVEGPKTESIMLEALQEVVQGARLRTPPDFKRIVPISEAMVSRMAEQLHGTERLYVVPDGIFAQVPWTALGDISEGAPWTAECRVGLLSYPQQLVDSRNRSPGRLSSGAKVLLVGNVDYGLKRGGPTTGEAADAATHWRELRGTKREIAAIAAILSGRATVVSLGGKEATVGALIENIPSQDVLHLATHGYSNLEKDQKAPDPVMSSMREGWTLSSPTTVRKSRARDAFSRTALVMAGANDLLSDDRRVEDDDGLASAEELLAVDMSRVRLVVLSACDTALGSSAGSEGMFSLQQAIEVAGARACVATLWKVPDHATSLLMSRFYENMFKQGQGPLEALVNAQRWFRDHPQEVWNSAGESDRGAPAARGLKLVVEDEADPTAKMTPPYYWAAFVLSGRGD